MSCIFCKIIQGEIPNYTIAESQSALAFLDIHPLVKGHTMVIPKAHRESILELEENEQNGVWTVVKEATEILKSSLHPDAFTIGINMGKAAGNDIEHLHIHIIPRWQGDGGGNIHSIIRKTPEESVENIHRQITEGRE